MAIEASEEELILRGEDSARFAGAVEVTFVIPCLNEAESLGSVLSEIGRYYKGAGLQYEIVVADNGSIDGSQQIALAGGAVAVDVAQRGYGAALQGGIKAANGDLIVMGDADGSYRFEDAAPMIELLRAGADLVMGDRFRGGIAPGAMPWLHRYVGNPVLSALGRVLFRVPVGDFHCGLRAFRRDRVEALGLKSSGMEFASEMVVMAQRGGLVIDEVPVRLMPDLRTRPPHLRTWTDGWRHLRFLLAHSPRWVFLAPAAAATLLALIVGILSAVGPISAGGIELSYRTSVVAAALGLVAAVAAWAFILAGVAANSGDPRTPYPTELAGLISALVFLGGLALVLSQFISWESASFGIQPVDRNLLVAIWGSFLMALGGISFFLSLLAGLLRTLR